VKQQFHRNLTFKSSLEYLPIWAAVSRSPSLPGDATIIALSP
jgi:hypothetical protein